MVAAATTAVPKYFPDGLDLPLPPEHATWKTIRTYEPLVAQALGDRPASIIAQLHYWQEKGCGEVYFGFRWIYNGYKEWHRQFPWLSEYTIGEIFRELERWGIVVSNNFNRHRALRLKWRTIDYYQLALQTGWNPYGLDLNRSYRRPPTEKEVIRRNSAFHSKLSTESGLQLPEWLDESKPLPKANVGKAKIAEWEFPTLLNGKTPDTSIYKSEPYISKSNPATDLKTNLEADQEVGGEQLLVNENDTHIDGEQEASSRVTESSSEGQCSAPTSLNHDKKIKPAQQFLASLNAGVERAERERTPALDLTRPIRIPGLDEESHYILWKHQASLLELNADLYAERIQKAIADNPQHLESAIRAFFENSASGAKTPEAATGFLFNALRQGWKPRHSLSSAQVIVPVYTPPPQMLSEPKPSTLEELVERKRSMWCHAPVLRSSIEAWVEQTLGVVMTHDGPARADATNAQARPNPEPKEAEHLVTPDKANFTPPEENPKSPQLDPNPPLEVEHLIEIRSEQPHLEVNQADNVASNPTPLPPETTADPARVEPPIEQSPKEPPQALPKQQRSNRRLQPVEILTSAGEWVGGYLVHQGIAVANLAGSLHRFKLFDALGSAYIFFGQIRPPASGLD